MARPVLTPGRLIITIGNLMYSIGAFVADFNETHVYNPNWPPHARFHNGQTMTLSLLLAAGSIWLAFRPALTGSKLEARDSLFSAAVLGSFYCLAGLTAILYPGTDWKDPDIEAGGAQPYLFSGIVAVIWAGYLVEMQRLGKVKKR